jgi:TetR/AcrR family transcriptional repressor of mexJK operon
MITEAAKRVFLRNGFTDTSVDAIAAEAGVSKQTIYNHFGDKERLFTAVVDAVRADATREAESLFAEEYTESGDLARDLRAAGRIVVRLVLAEDIAALRRLVITEQARHPELLDEWTRMRPVTEQVVTEEIERHARVGALNVDDARLAAHQLMILVVNEAVSESRYGLRTLTDAEICKIVDDGVEMWLRAYRAR